LAEQNLQEAVAEVLQGLWCDVNLQKQVLVVVPGKRSLLPDCRIFG